MEERRRERKKNEEPHKGADGLRKEGWGVFIERRLGFNEMRGGSVNKDPWIFILFLLH